MLQDLKSYKIIKELGHGGFSKVYLVRCLVNGLLYAMKTIKKSELDTE